MSLNVCSSVYATCDLPCRTLPSQWRISTIILQAGPTLTKQPILINRSQSPVRTRKPFVLRAMPSESIRCKHVPTSSSTAAWNLRTRYRYQHELPPPTFITIRMATYNPNYPRIYRSPRYVARSTRMLDLQSFIDMYEAVHVFGSINEILTLAFGVSRATTASGRSKKRIGNKAQIDLPVWPQTRELHSAFLLP